MEKSLKESFDDYISSRKDPGERSPASAYLKRQSYRCPEIKKTGFIPVPKLLINAPVVYIDGGNAVLFRSSSFIIEIIRVAGVMYQKNIRNKHFQKEMYCFIKIEGKDSSRIFAIEYYDINMKLKESIMIPYNAEDHLNNSAITDIAQVSGIARRLAELRFAEEISPQNGIIVLDGTLETHSDREKDVMKQITNKIKTKGSILTSISKSNNLITADNNPVNQHLMSISQKEPWIYRDLFISDNEYHKAEIHFVKLHEKSEHCFRFETFNSKDSATVDITKIASILRLNSIDPVFLGYPYGLIFADDLARVSNKEAEYFRTIIWKKLGTDKAKSFLASQDAHSILDKIKF